MSCSGNIESVSCNSTGAIVAVSCSSTGEIITISCCPPEENQSQMRTRHRAYARAHQGRLVLVAGVATRQLPGSGFGGSLYYHGGSGTIVPPRPNTKNGTLSDSGGRSVVEHLRRRVRIPEPIGPSTPGEWQFDDSVNSGQFVTVGF